MAKKIQPMRFSGRCEAMRAPTTENDTVQMTRLPIVGPSKTKKISLRVRPLKRVRIRLATASAMHSRHSHQASQAAARLLTPPALGPRSLAPSVTGYPAIGGRPGQGKVLRSLASGPARFEHIFQRRHVGLRLPAD